VNNKIHCETREIRFPNSRVSTPCFHVDFARHQLLDSDASKERFRIQDSVVRILKKSRRQKPVVGEAAATPEKKASESGSVRIRQ
jgi:hypothetical protein